MIQAAKIGTSNIIPNIHRHILFKPIVCRYYFPYNKASFSTTCSNARLLTRKELSLRLFDGVKPTKLKNLNSQFKWLYITSEYKDEILSRMILLNSSTDLYKYNLAYEKYIFSVLHKISEYLVENYPLYFELLENGNFINNKVTGIIYPLYSGNPLYTLGCLTTQDFNIIRVDKKSLVKSDLVGSITLYPVGWTPEAKINSSLGILHENVKGWNIFYQHEIEEALRLGKSLYKYRTNMFIQTSTNLTQKSPKEWKALFNVDGLLFKDLYLRREFQVFFRLSESLVLFSVDTFIEPLGNRSLIELCYIYRHFKGLNKHEKAYHKFDIWGPVLNKFIMAEAA